MPFSHIIIKSGAVAIERVMSPERNEHSESIYNLLLNLLECAVMHITCLLNVINISKNVFYS